MNYFLGQKPSLSVEDQFFMTLIKLRVHPPHEELSIMFGVNVTEVRNVFVTWLTLCTYSGQKSTGGRQESLKLLYAQQFPSTVSNNKTDHRRDRLYYQHTDFTLCN